MAVTLTVDDYTELAGLVSGGVAPVGAEQTAFVAALVTRAALELKNSLDTNNGQVDANVQDAITTTKSKAAVQGSGIVKNDFDTVNGGNPAANLTAAITTFQTDILADAATAANSDISSDKAENEFTAFSEQVDALVTEADAIDLVTTEDSGDTLVFNSGEDNEESVDVSEDARRTAFIELTTEAFLTSIRELMSTANIYNSLVGAGTIGVTQIL